QLLLNRPHGGVCRRGRVPQIIERLVFVVVGHGVTPRRSRSRRKPRCRLTRTESGVRPVTLAISGPDIPSIRRSARVSRYASGIAWIAAIAERASADTSGRSDAI